MPRGVPRYSDATMIIRLLDIADFVRASEWRCKYCKVFASHNANIREVFSEMKLHMKAIHPLEFQIVSELLWKKPHPKVTLLL